MSMILKTTLGPVEPDPKNPCQHASVCGCVPAPVAVQKLHVTIDVEGLCGNDYFVFLQVRDPEREHEYIVSQPYYTPVPPAACGCTTTIPLDILVPLVDCQQASESVVDVVIQYAGWGF